MRQVEFRLDGDALANDATPHAPPRRLQADDWTGFAEWISRYHALAWKRGNETELLELGRDIHGWLDRDGWLAALRRDPAGGVVAAFATTARPDEHSRLFLEVPWELIAEGDGHLAADPTMMWAPLRRIGPTGTPPSPGHAHRLGLMFMAADPRGAASLAFEAEEIAILGATRLAGLDLMVEDSGNLDRLKLAWREAGSLDALHLSCHGLGGAEPFLALEGEGGELADASLFDLAAGFVDRWPKLLFLSACHTGEGDADVDSLARGLVGAGFPAVLGWADAVADSDASAFAAAFYGQAAQPGTTVEAAWAAARFGLLRPNRRGRVPAHWHLARLFLRPAGGGALATGRGRRLRHDPDAGRKGIIEARGTSIGCATRFEFVGRRRQIQAIRREFRHPDHAGVLIHGFGRQGKTSLAARIMDRCHELTAVVLYRDCAGASVLAEIQRRVPGAGEICDHYLDRVDPGRTGYDPQALHDALRALFDGPCRDAGQGQPILLVLDDFEDLLEPPTGTGPWRVRAEAAQPLAAIIRAFDRGEPIRGCC